MPYQSINSKNQTVYDDKTDVIINEGAGLISPKIGIWFNSNNDSYSDVGAFYRLNIGYKFLIKSYTTVDAGRFEKNINDPMFQFSSKGVHQSLPMAYTGLFVSIDLGLKLSFGRKIKM